MSVVPLNARTAQMLAKLSAEPAPSYVVLSREAREAMTSLKARVGELDRMFSASATPASQAARIEALCAEIRTEAHKIMRASR